jgi:hypothetical protein
MHPFLAHLIGDFILQNEWMATNKKRSSFPCAVHTLVYLIPFLLCDLQWWQVAVIGIQHFAQDRSQFVLWWMRVWKRSHPEHWKDLPLYVDQVFHLVWIQFVIWLGAL